LTEPFGAPIIPPMSGPVTLGARVLFVDDEEAIRRLFETFLSNEGFDVRGASTLADALENLESEWPEVVIVDKNLPDGSGLKVLHTCRRDHPEIEVIVLTGYPTLESAIDALRLGAFDYIIKPVLDLDLVSEKIRRALERRHLRTQNHDLAEQLSAALESLEESLNNAAKALEAKSFDDLGEALESALRATRKARSAQPALRSTDLQ
jgi:DNA-binding NtrC family response regulator